MKLHHNAKVVTLDIETAPIKACVWSLWKQNVGLNQISSEWFLLSFCAKWMHKNSVIYDDMRGKVHTEDDRHLLQKLWHILNEADIVVTQNGVAFDHKKINARFLLNGFPPPSPYKMVDTKLMAKQKFAFTSNRLEWMADKLSPVKKEKHKKFPGFELWVECLKDNPEAWDEMKEYNIPDVTSTEQVYLKMRAWIDGHPNVNVYDGRVDLRCHRCGSDDLARRGFYYTDSGKYQRYRCNGCGGWSRSRYTENTPEKRKALLR